MKNSKTLQAELDQLVNDLDQMWLDNLDPDDYMHTFENQDIINNFKENFRTNSHGILSNDDQSGKFFIDKLGRLEVIDLIKKSSELESMDDVYTQWNEMSSLQIGEMEHEIDSDSYPELVEEFGELVYGYPCERLILKLDPDLFLELANKILKKEHKAEIVKISDFKRPKKIAKIGLVPATVIQFSQYKKGA